MCTVTYYKSDDAVILTSNRDEHKQRPSALPPQLEHIDGMPVLYPKDPTGGGTWFGVNTKGIAFVLLNGADSKHTPHPPYRKSRGLIVLEMASQLDYENRWHSLDLRGIEPFTLIVANHNDLSQHRWDGKEKSLVRFTDHQPRIWSSATLYHPTIIGEREIWYRDFIQNKSAPLASQDLFDFHRYTHTDDSENGLIIGRTNNMLTKSITQVAIHSNHFMMSHYDLLNNDKFNSGLFIQ